MNRQFGIELEIANITREKAYRAIKAIGVNVIDSPYSHSVIPQWKIVSDGSVTNGFEVVSPIMFGEAGLTEVRAVANALKAAGASTNVSCGTHIHMNIRDTPVDEVRTIVRRYATFEEEIDAFMSPSRRGNNNRYCQSIKDLPSKPGFNTARDVYELANIQGGRYYKVNLQSFDRHRTLEFRQHNGIIDADRIDTWIRLLDQFMTESARIANQGNNPFVDTSRMTATLQNVANAIIANGSITAEFLAEQFGMQVHSARAVITRIRRCGYKVITAKRNGQTWYSLQGNSPAADSLWAGIDADIATFYKQRAAVLALA